MIEIIGLILAALGAGAGILGSWYVSGDKTHQRRKGFSIWICSNPINMIVIVGVILKVWSGLPLIFYLITMFYFTYTAYRGWKSNGVPS